MSNNALIYNWQEQPDNFLKWLLPNLMAVDRDAFPFDELSEKTEKWTKVVLTMQINGVDVPTGNFFESLTSAFNAEVERKAREILKQVCQSDEIEEVMRDLKYELQERLQKIGIKLPEWEGDW